MAARTSDRRGDGDPRREPSSAPVGRGGKDRRASLVIKETAQLLNGLHEDADRSNALMAELEALLAAAQHASGQVQLAPGAFESDINAAQQVSDAQQMFQFSSVEPIQVPDSGAEAEVEVEAEVEAEADAGAGADAGADAGAGADDDLSGPAPATPPPAYASTKRRSSVVTFDGSSLLGGLPPAGGGAGASGGQLQQPSPTPPAAFRSMSFSRPRTITHQVAGRSFTERSNVVALRRHALTDMGVGGQQTAPVVAASPAPAPQQQQQLLQQHLLQPQHAGPSVSAMASALAAVGAGSGGGGIQKRPSSMDAVEFAGNVQNRRSSGVAYISSSSGPGMTSHGVGGTGLRDDSEDGAGLDGWGLGVGQGLGLGQAGGLGGGGSSGGAARISGGGSRFMKILKGIFTHHPGDASGSGSPSTACGSPSLSAAATNPLSAAATNPLESALTHGPLSSMAPVRASSRGHVPIRGSLTTPSLTVAAAADQKRSISVQRHPGSVGSAGPVSGTPLSGPLSPLIVGRSSGSTTSMPSPHALVPTPPPLYSVASAQHQQLLRRQTSVSGAMQVSVPSGPVTPTALLSPAGSTGVSPASPNTTWYGMVAPSAVDCRLAGGLSSRRSIHLTTTTTTTTVGPRGQGA